MMVKRHSNHPGIEKEYEAYFLNGFMKPKPYEIKIMRYPWNMNYSLAGNIIVMLINTWV